MRIGSEAPKRRTHSSNRHESEGTCREFATSNRHRYPITSVRTGPKLSRCLQRPPTHSRPDPDQRAASQKHTSLMCYSTGLKLGAKMNRRELQFDGICKCVAFLWAFALLSSTPVLALNANDLRNKLVEISQASLVAASPYVVDGLALGDQVKFGNQAYQRYQCSPSDEFSGFISCNEEHTTTWQ